MNSGFIRKGRGGRPVTIGNFQSECSSVYIALGNFQSEFFLAHARFRWGLRESILAHLRCILATSGLLLATFWPHSGSNPAPLGSILARFPSSLACLGPALAARTHQKNERAHNLLQPFFPNPCLMALASQPTGKNGSKVRDDTGSHTILVRQAI